MPRKKPAAEVPPLDEVVTFEELRLLRASPYDHPRRAEGREVAVARRLIDRGLLERDPTATWWMVRCTMRGNDVRQGLTAAGVERAFIAIRSLACDDHERAATLERNLHLRVLVEVADAKVPVVHLARLALRTSGIEFRRG